MVLRERNFDHYPFHFEDAIRHAEAAIRRGERDLQLFLEANAQLDERSVTTQDEGRSNR